MCNLLLECLSAYKAWEGGKWTTTLKIILYKNGHSNNANMYPDSANKGESQLMAILLDNAKLEPLKPPRGPISGP
jgi:hypothetical protein